MFLAILSCCGISNLKMLKIILQKKTKRLIQNQQIRKSFCLVNKEIKEISTLLSKYLYIYRYLYQGSVNALKKLDVNYEICLWYLI